MDIEFGKNITSFSPESIKHYFINNPEFLQTKKGKELQVGLILSAFIKKVEKMEVFVGFPMKEIKKRVSVNEHFQISDLLENSKLIDDTDVDFMLITPEDQLAPVKYAIQLVSVPPRFSDPKEARSHILKILTKKCMRSRDESLWLLISIQESCSTNIDDLRKHLDQLTVPYGKISLIGMVDQKQNKFQLVEIWPRFVIEEPITITLTSNF